MKSGLVLYEVAGRVATITLNRPEVLNAIISPMWQELNESIAEANRNPEVRVIRLRGAGRSFCAGAWTMLIRNSASFSAAGVIIISSILSVTRTAIRHKKTTMNDCIRDTTR